MQTEQGDLKIHNVHCAVLQNDQPQMAFCSWWGSPVRLAHAHGGPQPARPPDLSVPQVSLPDGLGAWCRASDWQPLEKLTLSLGIEKGQVPWAARPPARSEAAHAAPSLHRHPAPCWLFRAAEQPNGATSDLAATEGQTAVSW